ncbi:MAG: VWA domain-containing protein [Myxococcales bacterium]|nr:VWA domain-containing protein [Myxococcales bacterium]
MSRLLALAALSTTALLLAPQAAEADSCSAPRVMVILDKSSSMQTGTIGTQTKWSVAVDGLGQVLNAHQAKAEFGLITFPRAGQCSPGQVDVAPAMSNRTQILNALTTPPPEAGNYTPMAQTLETAAADPSLAPSAAARHVILITDGWQYCVPYDPATRYDGVPAVETLTQQGVTTWVVGFGAEVDPVALNRMAVAANTARPGCNPNNTDAGAPDNCYFQVDNAAELVTALNAIAGSISGETCDGVDNDCNGQVDDNLSRSCSSACGVGSESCSAGAWGGCNAPQPKAETCDGVDNDCDGQVDEPDAALCPSGEVCTNGMCEPGGNGETGDMQAGCSCNSSGLPNAGTFAPWLVLGALLIRRRRR